MVNENGAEQAIGCYKGDVVKPPQLLIGMTMLDSKESNIFATPERPPESEKIGRDSVGGAQTRATRLERNDLETRRNFCDAATDAISKFRPCSSP